MLLVIRFYSYVTTFFLRGTSLDYMLKESCDRQANEKIDSLFYSVSLTTYPKGTKD